MDRERGDGAILVVDDDVNNLRVAVDLLESAGHRVRTAKDGPTALRRLAKSEIGLVLLDVQMPGWDGYETCRRLKDDPAYEHLPVIFTTALADIDAKVRAFEAGGVDYVTKPLEARELIARVETHLKVGALQAALAARNDELAELNAHLQQRVDEQVGDLKKRAVEIDTLNTRLRVQVRDRSEALARALRRLDNPNGEEESLSGLVLGGRFKMGRALGRGGMGAVYRAVDRSTDEPVAIKVMRLGRATPSWAVRFLREARATVAVDHPAIVRLHHIDVDDEGRLFQVLEHLDGVTLGDASRDRAMSEGEVARVIAVLAEGLAAAHTAGVVHRDLKPDNLMLVAAAPGLKVLDFGVSKIGVYRDDAEAAATSTTIDPPTGDGVLLGTPRYMSPEQLAAMPTVGPPADIYAAGIIARDLMHAEGVSQAGTQTTALARRAEANRRAQDGARPDWIAACLHDYPGDRVSAKQLAIRCHKVADDVGVPTLPDLIKSTGWLAERSTK
jgi:CheY-like chemotaxis protein